MKFLLLALLSILVLNSSCRMPDDVGVGANGNQYDYLGASQQWPLSNDQGQGFGLNVWASWSLSPTKFVMITREREYNPFDKAPTPVIIDHKDDKPVDQTIGEQVAEISSVTKNMSSTELVFWLVVLGMLALTVVMAVPRVIGYLKAKKA